MRRRSCQSQRLPAAIALLGVVASGPAVAAPRPEPAPAPEAPAPAALLLDRGIAALHAGHHDRAEELFLEAARRDPRDPEPHALRALSLWWRILGDRQDRSYDSAFHATVTAALQAGGDVMEEAAVPDTATAHQRAFTGMALVLRFHIRGLRREFRDAARDARRGHELLEQAMTAEPAGLDPLFALGAYNYFADSLPALARGLRVLMRVPSGDVETGLDQLRRLAGSRSRLALHARLLLALVEASGARRCYATARADLEAARARHPDSPLVHATAGTIQLRLGFHDEAARDFAAALERAGDTDEASARLRRSIGLRLAEARLSAWRLDEAEALLRSIRDDGASTPRETQTAARLAEEIDYRRGRAGPPGSASPDAAFAGLMEEGLAARAADPDRAIRALHAATARDPAHPVPWLLLGEILIARQRAAEAIEALEAAKARAGEAPAWLVGWVEIDRGLALRALGRERAARARFESASETHRFRSADRGLYELEAGSAAAGRCGG